MFLFLEVSRVHSVFSLEIVDKNPDGGGRRKETAVLTPLKEREREKERKKERSTSATFTRLGIFGTVQGTERATRARAEEQVMRCHLPRERREEESLRREGGRRSG